MGKSTKRYTDEFKKQIVELKKNGRGTTELMKEYDLTKTSINTWVRQYANSSSFRLEDNQTEEEKELKQLRKEIKQLRMENDILKQAALILGRKDI
jgi:transposase